jgi:uncharacterized Fe-S radical SAM superfamily protein PflX
MQKDRMFSGIIITIAIFLGLLSMAAGHKERPTQAFMRQKLVYSQGILEGLTLEKYELVITNATALRNMNLTNSFTKMADPYFAKGINDFQTRVDVVIKGARNKLLDGTTEAYSKMLESCVACHKECRVEQVRASNPAGK